MFENEVRSIGVESYKIDRDDTEMITAKFLSDPINALQLLRDKFVEESGDLTGVASFAVDMLQSVRDAAKDKVANISHTYLRAYVECDESDIIKQNQNIIALLKEAGYTKTEVATWAKVIKESDLPYEALQARSALAIVNTVYGNTD